MDERIGTQVLFEKADLEALLKGVIQLKLSLEDDDHVPLYEAGIKRIGYTL